MRRAVATAFLSLAACARGPRSDQPLVPEVAGENGPESAPRAPASVELVPAPKAPEEASPVETRREEPASASAVLALADEAARLFEARCYECHGAGKRPKGGLRLSDMPAVLARPPEEALLVPGEPERSPLFARLTLPAGHEDLMPPEDGPLAPEELALVRRWIEAGAPWPAAARAPEEPLPVPAEPIASLTAEQRAARDAALARLAERGAHARRLSAVSEAVEVDLAVALPPAGAADLALLEGLEPCLVELSLARASLSEAELAPLAAFTELRRLRLDQVALGEGGVLAFLRPLARLESLNLYGARLTPAALPTLRGLASLRRLYVGASGLAPEHVAELARALPACAVLGDDPR